MCGQVTGMSGTSAPIFHQHRYALELDRLVPADGRWLDVGAGRRIHDGWLPPSSAELASRVRHLAGCDVSKDILENPFLHERQLCDASNLPWSDESYDLVSANMVVEHLRNPEQVFREIFRVLKPAGAFVFVTPNQKNPIIGFASLVIPPVARRLFAIHVQKRIATDVFVTEYRCNTVGKIRRTAEAVGFMCEKVEAFVNEASFLPSVFGRVERWIGHLAARSRLGRTLGSDIVAVLRKPSPRG
jgi:ubiquinone/menaquinone biosynthesis C-methylase UbiE